ncbi:MAG: helix-turn-helix domain-containing protein [Pseudomonadota bacterium]
MMENWDFYVRLLAIGAALLLNAQIAAGEIRNSIKLPIMMMVIGAIAYLLNTTPVSSSRGVADALIDLMSLSVPFWIWLFARNLFEREAPQRVVLIVAAVLVAAWSISNFFAPSGVIGFYVIHLLSLGLIADLVRVAFGDREDDLVEQRRLIRLWLPLVVAAQAGSILTGELIFAPGVPPPAIQLINALMIFLLVLFGGLSLFRTDPELLVQTEGESAGADGVETLNLSPSEAVLHEKLIETMEAGFYRTPGLTIARLAEHLDTPEHRLRALINQRLGYRNFSAFLNHHRIAEARAKLVDKEQVDLPVLTIAMDLGYNSLPTFNRAFRSETGTTPTDFRRLGLGEPSAQPTGQN